MAWIFSLKYGGSWGAGETQLRFITRMAFYDMLSDQVSPRDCLPGLSDSMFSQALGDNILTCPN